MKYYAYESLGEASGEDYALYTPLLFEIDAANDKLLAVLNVSATEKIHSTEDGGLNWTEEIDTGCDGLIMGYHDATNEKIYLVEHNNLANATTCYIDYSDWENISRTAQNGDLGADIGNYNADIFLRDGNLEAIVCDGAQIDARRYNNPWASIDTQADGITRVSMVVIVGTIAYFWGDDSGNNKIYMYKFDGATITQLDDIAATSRPTTALGSLATAYDGNDVIYMTLKDDGTGNHYLYSYSITSNTITKLGEFTLVFTPDRSIPSGSFEKAYNYGSNDIYQLHSEAPFQFHKIGLIDLETGYSIASITEHYVFTIKVANNVIPYKYTDQINYLQKAQFINEVMEAPSGMALLKKGQIPLEENMVMKFYDTYEPTGTEQVIFEGYIEHLGELPRQDVLLVSMAKDDLEEKPSGDYSGRSDQIISSLISDYCDYITEGTLSAGTAMGTITFGGMMTLEEVLDWLAYFEDWVWYLSPTGVLYFDNGTTDNGQDFTQASNIFKCSPFKPRKEYNKIKVRGLYIDGVQTASDWEEDLESQQRLGKRPKEFDCGFLDTSALCNTCATNLLSRLGTVPQGVKFNLGPFSNPGFMQPGHTITFEYSAGGITLASDQYIINSVFYNKIGLATYTVSSDLI